MPSEQILYEQVNFRNIPVKRAVIGQNFEKEPIANSKKHYISTKVEPK